MDDANVNCLDAQTRRSILNHLIEGCSIRTTVRLTGTSINTVLKLLVQAGGACAEFHDKHVRDLKVRRMQADEIWSFVG